MLKQMTFHFMRTMLHWALLFWRQFRWKLQQLDHIYQYAWTFSCYVHIYKQKLSWIKHKTATNYSQTLVCQVTVTCCEENVCFSGHCSGPLGKFCGNFSCWMTVKSTERDGFKFKPRQNTSARCATSTSRCLLEQQSQCGLPILGEMYFLERKCISQ